MVEYLFKGEKAVKMFAIHGLPVMINITSFLRRLYANRTECYSFSWVFAQVFGCFSCTQCDTHTQILEVILHLFSRQSFQ